MTRPVLDMVETPADEPGRASLLLASLHATSDWGWRTAGLFFALPGASVLVTLDVPVMNRVFTGVVCAIGIVLVAWPHWPIAVRRFGPLIPILATANLWWPNVSSHGVAFPVWEIVLRYAAGIIWIGLTQATRALWLSPLFVGSFLLTSPAVFDAASVFAACLSVGVMSAVAHTVSSELRRGRGAYAKMRQGVHHMTAVVTSEKTCPRKSPSGKPVVTSYRATSSRLRSGRRRRPPGSKITRMYGPPSLIPLHRTLCCNRARPAKIVACHRSRGSTQVFDLCQCVGAEND